MVATLREKAHVCNPAADLEVCHHGMNRVEEDLQLHWIEQKSQSTQSSDT